MSKKKATPPKFPSKLYVVIDGPPDDAYFLTHETLNTVDEDKPIAVYELMGTGKVVVSRDLIED